MEHTDTHTQTHTHTHTQFYIYRYRLLVMHLKLLILLNEFIDTIISIEIDCFIINRKVFNQDIDN